MKDKKSNINQPQQRDPWSLLQAQLGLLSTPVQHEQVSMVGAVDPREVLPETSEEQTADECQETVTIAFEEGVVVNESSPCESDNTPEEKQEEKANTFQMFEFDDFGECDIPRNAFGNPQKTDDTLPVQQKMEEPVADVTENMTENLAFSSPEQEVEAKEEPFDPFASDELPTSLWQPRKPASVAAPVASKPTLSLETIGSPHKETVKPASESAGRETVRSNSSDESVGTSSGKKRRERGKNHETKPEGRKSFMDNATNDDSATFGEEKRRRKFKEPTPEAGFGDFPSFAEESFDKKSFDDNVRVERSEEDDFSTSKSFKRRGRRDGGSPRQKEPVSTEPSFTDGFGGGLNASDEMAFDEPWQDKPATTERNDRFPKKRRGYKAPIEEEDVRETDRNLRAPEVSRNDSENEGRGRRRPKSQETQPDRQNDRPSDRPKSPQKISVPNWDDAINGIIEKNMQRHPPKGDRKNGNGNRGRRR